MSTIINATTTNGVVIQPDNSGSLVLQTNSGTTALTIDTSQNVGIGTTSPNYGGWTKALTVYSTNYSGVEVASNVTTNGNTVGAYDFIATSNSTKKEIAQIYANIVNGGSNPTNFGGSLIFSSKPDGGDVTERMRIDSAGNLLFNSGYGSVATAYGCRAWVNFNGTGTIAIRASGNVTSITDGGVGNYTINFSTAMPDTNYTTTLTCSGESRANSARCPTIATTGSTSAITMDIYNPAASGFQDAVVVMAAIFR